MKTSTIKLIIVMLVSSLMVACGGSGGGKSINGKRKRTSGTNQTTGTYSQSQYSGIIYSDYGQSYEFQETVEAFLSAIDDPVAFVGNVDGSAYAKNITFDARIETDQRFNRNNYNYTNVRSNAEVSLVIYDDLANSDPETYPPINIIANRGATGYVDGDTAMVEVEWELGTITFEGYIDDRGDVFYGEVKFKNFNHYDGGSGTRGTLGLFEVGVCDFFVCQ